MSEDQKKQLQTQLWNIANELRGRMDADEFRDYILGFIFYKYLSEKIHLYANKLLRSDGLDYENVSDDKVVEAIRKETLDALGYFLKPSELFHLLVKRSISDPSVIEELEGILKDIERSTMGTDSQDDFENLFTDLDLNNNRLGKTVSERNQLISKILQHLDKIDFQLENSEIDVLGDAYEYLLAQFASGAGKKAGEFYTPQEVSEVLARIVTIEKKRLKNIYDPTCGSGSLLLRVAKYAGEVGKFYGQELNITTYNLARMNMILHDVRYDKFDLRQGDTLKEPEHFEDRFEAVVANPPFSAKWAPNPNILMNDDRFSQYGVLAPASKADYAFIQHMIFQLDENGTMATVMPHGVLFRGASEGKIREYLIKEKNYLDAVIGLPANLFYGASIPACILVFKKCREDDENILFIDASQHFEKGKNQNKLRKEDIDKIIETYRRRKEIEKYSHIATLAEVAENDYNLNIPRYVDTFEEEEEIDLTEVASEIKKVDAEMVDIDKKIQGYCKELGIDSPF